MFDEERAEPQEREEREERAEDAGKSGAGADGSDETAGGGHREQGEQDQQDEQGEEKIEKRVDEDWKAEARREKEKIDEKIQEKAREEAERSAPPPADFLHFVSGIAAQVLMQLGEIENPIAGKKAVDLAAARYSIDILQMLEEKTKGNLTPDEGRYLTAALHDLRMRFVGAATGGPGKETRPGSAGEPD